MSYLKNKTILILSPQAWGSMHISKHHYAIALAKRGNKVYFLNPPGEGHRSKKKISINEIDGFDNLFLVTHRLSFPYNLKFHVNWLFHKLMRKHAKKLWQQFPIKPDIIWSFDLNYVYSLPVFGNRSLKIFHPVDEPLDETAIRASVGADVIFSVTKEILEKYKDHPAPKYLINHGISEDFIAPLGTVKRPAQHFRVGFAGNLLRRDIDRKIILQIVRENKDVLFECWGSYTTGQSNLGGKADDETRRFITELKGNSNVVLHGPVPSADLARAIRHMDAFLICYDVQKDSSRGTNYHKIMEFLSTGKIVISNNVTAYKDEPDLVQMVSERDHNQQLPGLFKKVMNEISTFNSSSMINKRVSYARSNTYQDQVSRIEQILENINSQK